MPKYTSFSKATGSGRQATINAQPPSVDSGVPYNMDHTLLARVQGRRGRTLEFVAPDGLLRDDRMVIPISTLLNTSIQALAGSTSFHVPAYSTALFSAADAGAHQISGLSAGAELAFTAAISAALVQANFRNQTEIPEGLAAAAQVLGVSPEQALTSYGVALESLQRTLGQAVSSSVLNATLSGGTVNYGLDFTRFPPIDSTSVSKALDLLLHMYSLTTQRVDAVAIVTSLEAEIYAFPGGEEGMSAYKIIERMLQARAEYTAQMLPVTLTDFIKLAGSHGDPRIQDTAFNAVSKIIPMATRDTSLDSPEAPGQFKIWHLPEGFSDIYIDDVIHTLANIDRRIFGLAVEPPVSISTMMSFIANSNTLPFLADPLGEGVDLLEREDSQVNALMSVLAIMHATSQRETALSAALANSISAYKVTDTNSSALVRLRLMVSTATAIVEAFFSMRSLLVDILEHPDLSHRTRNGQVLRPSEYNRYLAAREAGLKPLRDAAQNMTIMGTLTSLSDIEVRSALVKLVTPTSYLLVAQPVTAPDTKADLTPVRSTKSGNKGERGTNLNASSISDDAWAVPIFRRSHGASNSRTGSILLYDPVVSETEGQRHIITTAAGAPICSRMFATQLDALTGSMGEHHVYPIITRPLPVTPNIDLTALARYIPGTAYERGFTDNFSASVISRLIVSLTLQTSVVGVGGASLSRSLYLRNWRTASALVGTASGSRLQWQRVVASQFSSMLDSSENMEFVKSPLLLDTGDDIVIVCHYEGPRIEGGFEINEDPYSLAAPLFASTALPFRVQSTSLTDLMNPALEDPLMKAVNSTVPKIGVVQGSTPAYAGTDAVIGKPVVTDISQEEMNDTERRLSLTPKMGTTDNDDSVSETEA